MFVPADTGESPTERIVGRAKDRSEIYFMFYLVCSYSTGTLLSCLQQLHMLLLIIRSRGDSRFEKNSIFSEEFTTRRVELIDIGLLVVLGRSRYVALRVRTYVRDGKRGKTKNSRTV